jgi:hypothetical protein
VALRKITSVPNMNNEMLLVVFVGLTGFALLVQAIILLAFFLTIRKTVTSAQADIQELRTTVMPILTRSREILERVAPKVESAATDMAELAHSLREQGAEIQVIAGEILDRVHRQTSRVDTLFTTMVDGVEHAGNLVADTVTRPVRQVAALLASVRAFLGVMTTGKRPARQPDGVAGQDMFV